MNDLNSAKPAALSLRAAFYFYIIKGENLP